MTDIEDRINECMQRSMNGKPLPMDSPEMIAIASYLRSLGAQYQASGAGQRRAEEPPAFKTPNRAADLAKGEGVFTPDAASVTARTAWDYWPPPIGARATCSHRYGALTRSTTGPACTAC